MSVVLVVDDDPSSREAVVEGLEREGYKVASASSGVEGLRLLAERDPALVLTDLVMPETDGLAILRAAREKETPPEVIVMTGYASVESAVEAMRLGAYDYLSKPVRLAEVREKAKRALERRGLTVENARLHRVLDERLGFERILGTSPALAEVFERIRQVAPTSATVLIMGESGTGKELVARAIHAASPRRAKPFLAVNCGALTESLLESELFGHDKGAFTGAVRERKGYFELSDGGTLLLDEIADTPLPLQVKLLRVLETREFFRVGGAAPVRVDVRILAATHQDLEKKVRDGLFREDLYYRLQVVAVRLPSLRERREDIPMLAEAFVREFAQVHGRPVRELAPEALGALVRYAWPGNVRELRNVIESLVITAPGPAVRAEDLPDRIRALPGAPGGIQVPTGTTMDDLEREAIRVTLERTSWNRVEAAKILGIGERTIQRKIKAFTLTPPGQNGAPERKGR